MNKVQSDNMLDMNLEKSRVKELVRVPGDQFNYCLEIKRLSLKLHDFIVPT